MTTKRRDLLEHLIFGRVDAESVQDLDKRFLRTRHFNEILTGDISLVLGPKGSGKSTLFELFGRHEKTARELAGEAFDDVIIVTGTGLLDLAEVATEDIESLKTEQNYDHEKLWRLYIAVKCATALHDQGIDSHGPVRELLRATGDIRDLRVLPLLQQLWRALVSPSSPTAVSVGALGASLELSNFRKRALDVRDLLGDVQQLLEASGKRIWILFDKIDELYPGDRAERQRALEGLFVASMSLRRAFPRIQPKIFLRTDLWSDLDFTNKTHLVDKMIRLTWSRRDISDLLIKGAAASPGIEEYLRSVAPTYSLVDTEVLTRTVHNAIWGAVIEPRIRHRGERKNTLHWIYDRIRDSHEDAFPRDAVMWLNVAADSERRRLGHVGQDAPLITTDTLPAAHSKVSAARRQAYLAEFPELSLHFERFEGQEGPLFEREHLSRLLEGLTPAGDQALRALHEVGVLAPVAGSVATAEAFEVPYPYRNGLNLTTVERV